MRDHTVKLDEGQRQMVLLSLAHLSIERPGWLYAIEELALKMDNSTTAGKPELLYEFRRLHTEATKHGDHGNQGRGCSAVD